MVLAGEAVAVALLPKPLLQLNVPPDGVGLAVNVAVAPAQMLGEFTVSVGLGVICILCELTSVQPVAEVTVSEIR